MKIQPNDLIFVTPTESESKSPKLVLVRVTKINADTIIGVMEATRHQSASTIEVPKASVALNVGETPPPGKVYGYDLHHIFTRRRTIDPLGEVAFFTRATKEQVSSLRTAAANVEKRLRKAKLDFILEAPIDYHIVSKERAGKYAGMYHHSKDLSKHNHKIEVTLDDSRRESASINTYEYVLAHEIGHALHFGYLKNSDAADAAWVRAYTRTVRPIAVPTDLVEFMLETLIKSGSVDGARGEIPEDGLPAWKRVLNEVRTSSGLTPKEIDLLLKDNRTKTVKEAWPRTGLMRNELHPSVTQYALKNYRELFAETFAFRILGKDLPEDLEALITKSVSYVISQS